MQKQGLFTYAAAALAGLCHMNKMLLMHLHPRIHVQLGRCVQARRLGASLLGP